MSVSIDNGEMYEHAYNYPLMRIIGLLQIKHTHLIDISLVEVVSK